MVVDLWLPILVSALALFFASFVSWMVLMLHKRDWLKVEREDEFLDGVREIGLSPGSYMFPGCNSPEEMNGDEYKQKFAAGPCGIMTVFSEVNMKRNLGLTFLYFLVCSFCLGYLATIAFPTDATVPPPFMQVFRFVATAALLTFLAAIVQHAIWFHNRIAGHVIESVAYAFIMGMIFASLWP